MGALEPGDRLWLVSSGQGLGIAPAQAGWLVEVWQVLDRIPNPGDDARYPPERYAHRILARLDQTHSPAGPINVDPLIRPLSSGAQAPIGQLLQGPRRLASQTVASLMALSHDPRAGSCSEPLPHTTPAAASTHAAPLDPDQMALGIRQPWAELILRGIKTIEVRTLETKVRGPIYVYASRAPANTPAAIAAARTHGINRENLPLGLLVGAVDIIDCRPCTRQDTTVACVPASILRDRWAWVLAIPRRMDIPVRPRFLPYGVWFYPFRRRNAESGR
jgi:hypothetical protein